MNLTQLIKTFDTEEKCYEHLIKVRWPKGVHCPRCKSSNIHDIRGYRTWICRDCRYQFSATAGTIFHDSHIPLSKWFLAIHLMCESKKGISAHQLHRELGITYKSAWYMSHRIRDAMKNTDMARLGGVVEIDETYIGGKDDKKGRPGKGGRKTPVIGFVERSGKVHCEAIKDVTSKTILALAQKHLGKGIEAVYTDDYRSYNILKTLFPHKSINHQITFVDGDVHTNGIENFWSLLKRGVIGIFHKISAKHLNLYLDEFMFRFNNRHNGDMLSLMLANCEKEHVKYEYLTC